MSAQTSDEGREGFDAVIVAAKAAVTIQLIAIGVLLSLGAATLGLSSAAHQVLVVHLALGVMLTGLLSFVRQIRRQSFSLVRGLATTTTFSVFMNYATGSIDWPIWNFEKYPASVVPFVVASAVAAASLVPFFFASLFFVGSRGSIEDPEAETARRPKTPFVTFLATSPLLFLFIFILLRDTSTYQEMIQQTLIEGATPDWLRLLPTWEQVREALRGWPVILALMIFLVPAAMARFGGRDVPTRRRLTSEELEFVEAASRDLDAEIMSRIPPWYRLILWLRRLLVLVAPIVVLHWVTAGDYTQPIENCGEHGPPPLLPLGVANPFLIAVAFPFAVLAVYHTAAYVFPSFRDLEARRAMTTYFSRDSRRRLLRSLLSEDLKSGAVAAETAPSSPQYLNGIYRGGERFIYVSLIVLGTLVLAPIDIAGSILDALNYLSPPADYQSSTGDR